MNNRICLNPDVKWHGVPRVFEKNAVRCDISLNKETGSMMMKFHVMLRKMSRKRLTKLLMAHGMQPRGAKKVAEEYTRKGWPHAKTYRFVIGMMHEFIGESRAVKEQKHQEDSRCD